MGTWYGNTEEDEEIRKENLVARGNIIPKLVCKDWLKLLVSELSEIMGKLKR